MYRDGCTRVPTTTVLLDSRSRSIRAPRRRQARATHGASARGLRRWQQGTFATRNVLGLVLPRRLPRRRCCCQATVEPIVAVAAVRCHRCCRPSRRRPTATGTARAAARHQKHLRRRHCPPPRPRSWARSAPPVSRVNGTPGGARRRRGGWPPRLAAPLPTGFDCKPHLTASASGHEHNRDIPARPGRLRARAPPREPCATLSPRIEHLEDSSLPCVCRGRWREQRHWHCHWL